MGTAKNSEELRKKMDWDKKTYKISIYSNFKGEINFIAELLCKMGVNHTFEEINTPSLSQNNKKEVRHSSH